MTTPFAEAAARVGAGADPHVEASALAREMTLEEQLGCLDGDIAFWPGLADMTAGGYYTHPWPAAVVERLGIPGIQFADGPRGAVIADGTAFPVSMARGALFDPAFEERIGDAVGLELRGSGATYTGAVCMNLLRHPAWGRAQETYGEDPHHVGRMAAAFTRGLERHVMACMKHFALNSMENARFSVDVSAGERALHEVYLPHFRHVAEQGIASVMSAYNSVNGEWCGENEELLTTILRDEWGWDGFVISDFIFGLRDAVKSVRAGLDIEMPFRQQRALALMDAVEDGTLDAAIVRQSVERTLATLLRYGHVYDHAPSAGVVNSAPHRALARETASACAVLLRNADSLLPIDVSTTGSVAVLGRLAAEVNLGDGGSSDVKSTTAITPLAGLRAAFGDAAVAHFDDLSSEQANAIAQSADVVVLVVGYTKADEGEYIDNSGTMALAAELFPPMDHPELGFAPAADEPDVVDGTATVDTATVDTDALGTDTVDASIAQDSPASDEVDEVGGMAKGGDRSSLHLSDADVALIADAVAVNSNVVVAVQCGSAVMMPWAESVSALLVSWYGGVEAGTGLADVLIGRSEPGGRLPFAIPTDVAHLVDFDREASDVTYGLLHGQWKLDADEHAAHFPFGAGEGYTSFELGDVEIAEGASSIRIELSNVGDRTGSTVVFAHASCDSSAVERPPKRLIGFARITGDPGGTTTATIELDWAQLDVRRDGEWWTESGDYVVHVGFDAATAAASVRCAR